MATGLIELEEGVLVEAEVEGGPRNIAFGGAEKVAKGFDQIAPLLRKVCQPVASVWSELNRDMAIDSAEIQLSLSFEGSGNLYLVKSKAGANLSVKLTLKPKQN